MAPLPQEHAGHPSQDATTDDDPISDDTIVISGVAGLLPSCESFFEFTEKIYNKQNLVTSDSSRWKNVKHPELSAYGGHIGPIDRFDAQVFSVFHKLANSTDPSARLLYEQTYRAIFDAGICPSVLFGKRIGVFMSAGNCETEKVCSCPAHNLGIVGCNRSMFANRISYWLNLKGPSMTMDGSCAGTLVALQQAYLAITTGVCEAAFVGSGRVILHPQTSIMSHRTTPQNFDGKTKCYDAAADGQSSSEAINVMFLQKYKDAKRVYAILRHVKAEFGGTDNGIVENFMRLPRDEKVLSNFYRDFYIEARVSPSDVEYVDGFGAACPELDKTELQAFELAFCKDRKKPLMVGSVTSNVGYTETASGSCGILKVLSAYQKGKVAATINCNPRQDIAAIKDGRMCIITENQEFDRSYAAVNAISLTGINAHALFQGHFKPKNPSKYHSDIPYLVVASGRQESGVNKILQSIEHRPIDPEEIALIHNIYREPISKHLARGYGIYSTKGNGTITHSLNVDYFDDARRPLWFVYSGMGSHWVGMGAQLMRISIFAKAIERCHKILEPKGVDLINIITTNDKTIFDNILHAFIGITAIQIALTDVMKALGIVPDKIIGHSLGELGCAYADGCFTEKETLLLAYNRGLVSIQNKFIHGSMAAVGVGYKVISKICPPEVEIACRNSANSCTISGPSEAVQKFVKKLNEDAIFAKEVKCANIPYHSRYIAEAGPEFLRLSKEAVMQPKLRSSRWISTSVPQDKIEDYHSLHCSAEYHTNNLLNKVLFEDVLRLVPSNAVLVEIAPHGLLQAILKRDLSADNHHVALTRRGHSDSALFLLEAIGKLYMDGYVPDISALYPKVEFPVATETRPLSHLVEFAYAEKWKLCKYMNAERVYCSVLQLFVTVEDDEYEYLNGHYIEGVRVFPYSACLVAVWDTLALTLQRKRKEISVQFQEIKFHSQPPVHDQQLLYLTVTVQRGSGRFEVHHDQGVVIEGFVFMTAAKNISGTDDNNESMSLTKNDVYKLLYERGYEYKDQFRSILRTNNSMTCAEIEWQDNWATFIDGILQMSVLRINHQDVSTLISIRRMTIDIRNHSNERINSKQSGALKATYNALHNKTRCGGVTVEDIRFKNSYPSIKKSVGLKTLGFVPFFQKENEDVVTSIYVFMQIIAENIVKDKLIVYFVSGTFKTDYINKIKQLMNSPPIIDADIEFIKKEDIMESKTVLDKADVVFLYDLISDKKVFEALYKSVLPNTFIISHGVESHNLYPTTTYRPISSMGSGKNKVELALFRPFPSSSNSTAVSIQTASDIPRLRKISNNLPPQHKLLVLAPNPAPSEVKDEVLSWRKEKKNVTIVMFDAKNVMDKELEKIPDMALCVLYDGVWGSNYLLPMTYESMTAKSVVALKCAQPGNLSSLSWIEEQELSIPGIEVTVHYAGLNAKDARRVMGENPSYSVNEGFGMDFSGVTASGERVMGLVSGGSVCSKVRALPQLLWPVPPHWTLEDAATVPLAYAHAFYLLCVKIQLGPTMSVLVHGGLGALGQACISIALSTGCEVFATVSDMRKKRFLKKLFPELRDDHIGNSRDTTFADMVKILTQGAGCDVVISCARGELKEVLFNCCCQCGVTFDTMQLETQDHYSYGMRLLTMERSYVTPDLSSIFKNQNFLEMRKLQLLVSEGIVNGSVRPLSRVTYEPQETSRAFRLLAASRHRGRVLLALRADVPLVQPRITCAGNRSYLVIIDNDGFGLQFVEMLINRGATKIVLHCLATAHVKHKIQKWTKQGVKVQSSFEDITQIDRLLMLITKCNRLGSLDGVYVIATGPKEQLHDMGLRMHNLDTAVRRLCPNLSHFAAISEDDSAWRELMIRRIFSGLPSLSLQLQNLAQFENSEIPHKIKPTEGELQWRNAMEASEKALCADGRLVLAYAQPVPCHGVIEEVTKIPGVNITNATVDRTTLEKVGVDDGRAKEVSNVLREKFCINIDVEVLPKMTIGELKKLKEDHLDLQEDVPGFGAYFSHVDFDEMQATSDLVLMPTLVHKSELRPDEFDVDRDFLCIVPGLEGHYNRFKTLTERLKIASVVLQPDCKHSNESIHELAKRLADIMMKKLKLKKTFYLLGYEFGVLVALEIASILEHNGMTGTVYMLGGTPEDIRDSFNSRWKDASSEMIQDSLIHYMYTLITGSCSFELQEALLNTNSWSDKLLCYTSLLSKKVSTSTQYNREIIEGAYSRIKQLQQYKDQTRDLKSKIVLIRAQMPVPAKDLGNFSKEEPSVHQLTSSLAHILKNLVCAKIVNKYLEPQILEAYDNSNQCETVLTNDSDFMSFQ